MLDLPAGSAVLMVSEAQWREWAIPIYRTLVAHGEDGASPDEIALDAWTTTERVADVIWWLRARGIAIDYRIVGPGEVRYILANRLPSAWEEPIA